MKKLLTILAAAGLTATTGATVVACANSAVDTKVAIKATVGTDTSIQLQNWDDILKNASGKTISLTLEKDSGLAFQETDYLQLAKDSAGAVDPTSAVLTVSKDDTNKGQINFNVVSIGTFKVTIAKNKDANLKATTVAITVAKKKISEITAPTITLGEEVANVKNAILAAIGVGAVEGTDVTIGGTALAGNTVVAGTVTVQSVSTSKLVTGDMKIPDVVKKDISTGVVVPTITVGETVADAKDAILAAIGVGVTANDVIFGGTAISGTTIVVGTITVIAADSSQLISGTLPEITTTLPSIKEVQINVEFNTFMLKVKELVQTAIDGVVLGTQLGVDYTISVTDENGHEITVGDDNTTGHGWIITVASANDSKLITNSSFTINVE